MAQEDTDVGTLEAEETDDGLQEQEGEEREEEGLEEGGEEEVDGEDDSDSDGSAEEGDEAAGEAEGEGEDSEGGEEGTETKGEGISPDTVLFERDGEDYTLQDVQDLVGHVERIAQERRTLDEQQQYLDRAIAIARERPADHLLSILSAKHGSQEAGRHAMYDLAEKIIAHRMKVEGMSDEERQRQQEIEQARRDREELEALRAEKQKTQQTQAEIEATNNLLAEINPALQAAEVPDSPKVIREVAQRLLIARENGVPMTVERAVRLVKKDLQKQGGPDWESLDLESIPDDVKEKIRQDAIRRLKRNKTQGQDSDEKQAETADGASSFDDDPYKWR